MRKTLLEKIWLGLLPLSLLYWGFAVIGGFIWKLLFNFIDDNNAIAVNTFLFVALAYQFFLNVGIWRAANNYNKSIFVAWLAKIATTIGTVILLITFLGFSKLKNIQNEVSSYSQPNQTQIAKQSNSNVDVKMHKIGATWEWVKLESDKENWWILPKRMRDEKFNATQLWLKTESLEKYKKYGNSYNYTVLLVSYSCSDKTFFVGSVTDSFTEESKVEDKEYYFHPITDGGYKKVNLNKKHALAAYNYACGSN